MSKAFVREDDIGDDALPLRNLPSVPPGAKNYMTARGADRLREELAHLAQKRSTLAVVTSDPEARRRVHDLDHHIRHLQQSLRTAEIISPAPGPTDVVRFGATVTVRDGSGIEARYRIVGVDETDLDRGDVSWLSPLARALLNARAGQRVRFKTPRHDTELEIVSIAYD
jgi:transcription elongation factor GreB